MVSLSLKQVDNTSITIFSLISEKAAVSGHKGSTVSINNSSFDQCEAGYGGFMFMETKSKLSIGSSTFLRSRAKYGGVIYATLNSTIAVQYEINKR